MAYHDLREYVAALEKHGKFKRVTKEVDKDWEIAAVCRQLFKKIPPQNGRRWSLKTLKASISPSSPACSARHGKFMPWDCKPKRSKASTVNGIMPWAIPFRRAWFQPKMRRAKKTSCTAKTSTSPNCRCRLGPSAKIPRHFSLRLI